MAWGDASMGSYSLGTRDVLTEFSPEDQAFAQFILQQRPDVWEWHHARKPNDSPANVVNDWAFGPGWKSKAGVGEIAAAGGLLNYAKGSGWQDNTPKVTFADGSVKSQAEMGSDLFRAGWGGEGGSVLQNNGTNYNDILTAYQRTSGRQVQTTPTPTPTPTPVPTPTPINTSQPPSWWPEGIPWAGAPKDGTPTLDLQRLYNEMYNMDFLRRQTFNEFAAKPENLAASLMQLGQSRDQVGNYLSQTPQWQQLRPQNPNRTNEPGSPWLIEPPAPTDPQGGFSPPNPGDNTSEYQGGLIDQARRDLAANVDPSFATATPAQIHDFVANNPWAFGNPGQEKIRAGLLANTSFGPPIATGNWDTGPLQGRHAPVQQTLNDFQTQNTNRLGLIQGLAGFSGTPASGYWSDFWTAAPKGAPTGATRWN